MINKALYIGTMIVLLAAAVLLKHIADSNMPVHTPAKWEPSR